MSRFLPMTYSLRSKMGFSNRSVFCFNYMYLALSLTLLPSARFPPHRGLDSAAVSTPSSNGAPMEEYNAGYGPVYGEEEDLHRAIELSLRDHQTTGRSAPLLTYHAIIPLNHMGIWLQ